MLWVCDAISLGVLPVLLCQTRPVVGCLTKCLITSQGGKIQNNEITEASAVALYW